VFFFVYLEKDLDYIGSSSDLEPDLQFHKSENIGFVQDPDSPEFRLDRTGPRRDFIRTLLTSDSEEEMDIKVLFSINYLVNAIKL